MQTKKAQIRSFVVFISVRTQVKKWRKTGKVAACFEPWLTAKVLSNLRHTLAHLAREFIDRPSVYLYEYYMFSYQRCGCCRFIWGPSFTAIRIHTNTPDVYMYKYPTVRRYPFRESEINSVFSLFSFKFLFEKNKQERPTKRYLNNKFEEFVGLIEFITLLGDLCAAGKNTAGAGTSATAFLSVVFAGYQWKRERRWGFLIGTCFDRNRYSRSSRRTRFLKNQWVIFPAGGMPGRRLLCSRVKILLGPSCLWQSKKERDKQKQLVKKKGIQLWSFLFFLPVVFLFLT